MSPLFSTSQSGSRFLTQGYGAGALGGNSRSDTMGKRARRGKENSEDIFRFFPVPSLKTTYPLMPRANYFFMHNKLSPLFTLCYRFNNKILRLQLLKTWEGFYRIWLPYREIFMLALLFYGLIQSNFGARIYGLIKMKRKN